MMEDTETEHLALCMRPEIGLEAERVDGGNESFDDIEGRAGDRSILRHVSSGTEGKLHKALDLNNIYFSWQSATIEKLLARLFY
jgi:hypothetical protein